MAAAASRRPPHRLGGGLGLMLPLTLLVVFLLASTHWLLEPMLRVCAPLFSLDWMGWGLGAVVIWLFAGDSSRR